jgi:hypothetical protein
VTGQEENVTRVVDVNTLGAAVRELAVGHESVTVVVRGTAGAVLGVIRTRTSAEQETHWQRVPPPRPAPRVSGRRETDPRFTAGVQTYGIPGPEMDAAGPLADYPNARRSTHGLARGTYVGEG